MGAITEANSTRMNGWQRKLPCCAQTSPNNSCDVRQLFVVVRLPSAIFDCEATPMLSLGFNVPCIHQTQLRLESQLSHCCSWFRRVCKSWPGGLGVLIVPKRGMYRISLSTPDLSWCFFLSNVDGSVCFCSSHLLMSSKTHMVVGPPKPGLVILSRIFMTQLQACFLRA